MSREIEFRGLATNGEYVYGSLVNNCVGLPGGIGQNTKTWIVTSAFGNGGWFNVRGRQYVKPETVGQYTGLLDCNGTKIFEGDIVRHYHFTDSRGKVNYLNHIVKWSDKFSSWFLMNSKSMSDTDGSVMLYQKFKERNYEVIGNIHQNPELLEILK